MVNYYNKDLYKILNISPFATEAEIKTAYRKAVRIYHPDVAGEDADVMKFKDIQEAYEILSSEPKRKKYDALHGYFKDKIRKEYEARKRRDEIIREDIRKAKEKAKEPAPFSHSINDALDNLFGANLSKSRSDKTKPKPKKGEDIMTEVTISVTESIKGTSRTVNVLNTSPCPKCEGRKFINTVDCDVCKGIGQISEQKKITVKIPPAVKNGAKIRIKNEGGKGLNGGKNGDLYLTVNIEKSSFFEIFGSDIVCTLPITPYEAVFGTEVPLDISNSKISVKIPPMTSSGQKLRLKGEGLEDKSKKIKGDIIITVEIKLPPELTKKEKDLYKKLSEISSYDIRKEFNDD